MVSVFGCLMTKDQVEKKKVSSLVLRGQSPDHNRDDGSYNRNERKGSRRTGEGGETKGGNGETHDEKRWRRWKGGVKR
jgi:hypothetical protein